MGNEYSPKWSCEITVGGRKKYCNCQIYNGTFTTGLNTFFGSDFRLG
jgi:hypothetical protein